MRSKGDESNQGRGGKGRRDIVASDRNGPVVALIATHPTDDLMLISTRGMIVRIEAGSVRLTRRAAKGVRVINLSKSDSLASLARIAESEGNHVEPSASTDD